MIDFYNGNLHDIEHFLKVFAFAKTIGEGDGLDAHTQEELVSRHHTYENVDGLDFRIFALDAIKKVL